MQVLLGLLFILGGVALGIYVGLVLMLVGGIASIINAVQIFPWDGYAIAWGIARIVFAAPAGVFAGAISVGVGLLLLMTD